MNTHETINGRRFRLCVYRTRDGSWTGFCEDRKACYGPYSRHDSAAVALTAIRAHATTI